MAQKYDGTRKRRAVRRIKREEVSELLVAMARENPRWGHTRLRGALRHLGYEIGRNTIKRILNEHGVEPAPERSGRTPWKTFLKAHWGAIAAADFFTVEVLTIGGLVRHWVFFVIDLATRRVELAGITAHPSAGWMQQVGRNLTDAVDGFLRDTRYLILDRDPLYTEAFRNLLADSGCMVVRLPAKSPNLNAFAERFVLSVKSECLGKIVPLSERHLRECLSEYFAHYHEERPHQGLGNVLIEPVDGEVGASGTVRCSQRLGGLLRHYWREAA